MRLFKVGFFLGIVLVILAGLLACGVTLANAQESTDTPTDSPTGETIEATPADDVLIQADDPTPDFSEAFAPILVMSSAIWAFLEAWGKPVIKMFVSDTESTLYRVVVWGAAGILAFVTILGMNSTANILAALGFFENAPPLVAQLVTAMAIAGGNGFLHVIYDYFRATNPGPTRTIVRG